MEKFLSFFFFFVLVVYVDCEPRGQGLGIMMLRGANLGEASLIFDCIPYCFVYTHRTLPYIYSICCFTLYLLRRYLGLQTKLLHSRGTGRRVGNYSCQGVERIGTSKGEGLRWDRGPGGGEWGVEGREEEGRR